MYVFIFLGKISKGVWFYLPIGIMLIISGIMLLLTLTEIKKPDNIECGIWNKLLERYLLLVPILLTIVFSMQCFYLT